MRSLPDAFATAAWDVIIFHTLFFSRKFDRVKQQKIFDKVAVLSKNQAHKILTPQDEFINSDIVCNFALKIGAKVICSVQPKSVWPLIYSDIPKIEIRSILTGYVDPIRISKSEKFLLDTNKRTIDIGYRTIGKPVPWFGRHGYLKEKIALGFTKALKDSGLRYDISTEDKDSLVGENWYEFLGNCKYTLGVEGGTSIFDRDGSIKQKVEAFIKNSNQNTNFELIESECFKGIDGDFKGFAISPRHLEACMTGTCQVLTEGDYSGILKPNIHFIPVSKNLDNIEEIIKIIKTDK